HREVHRHLRDLSSLVSKVKMCEQQRDLLRRQERDLAELPADLDVQLARLRLDTERLAETERALPHLERLHQKRKELQQAREQEQVLAQEEKRRLEEGEQLRHKQDELKKAHEAAQRERQQVDARAVQTRTLLEQARASLKEFLHLDGAKVCRQCGQP